MLDRLVVDASALAAVIFHEPKETEVTSILQRTEWFAPSLIDYEIASIARKKILKHPKLENEIRAAFQTYSRIKFQRIRVDFADVIDLALKRNLTTYDASYLWLASMLKCKLLTLDAKLGKVAEST